MRKLDILLANALFALHCLIGVFILSGWLFPEIKIFYLAFLVGWLACWVFLGYCPITKWEFTLRRKYNKNINPNDEAIQHYMYRFFKIRISSKAIFNGGLIVFTILVVLTLTVR
jgi:hypothetical protein